MGITAREDIAIGQTHRQDSKSLAFGSRTIHFAHKFVGGETSLDLLNLTTPVELSANGFVNASPTEIAAAHLSSFKRNVRLALSRGPSGLPLMPFGHYVISGNQLNFVGSLVSSGGALPGEILFGEIVTVPQNSIVIGDMEFLHGTFELLPGQSLVNIGYPYKVGKNETNGQVGDLKLKRNGVAIYRNVGNAAASPSANGNFHEDDSGNGYGTTATMNVPAGVQSDIIEWEIGFKVSSGEQGLYAALESLEGSIIKLAEDAAYNFYGDTDKSRYIAASPAAVERRSFGDIVASLLARVAALEAEGPNLFVRNSAIQVFPNASAVTPMIFGTVDEDNSGTFNNLTGVYTVPRSGRWIFTTHTASGSGQAWAAGQEWSNLFAINGSYSMRIGSNYSQAAHSIIKQAPGSLTRRFVAGNTVSVNIFHTRGSNTNNQGDANLNYFTGSWLGA